MRTKKNRYYRKDKRNIWLIVGLSFIGLVIAGGVAWVGWNGWDLRKSVSELQTQVARLGIQMPSEPTQTDKEKEEPTVPVSGENMAGGEIEEDPAPNVQPPPPTKPPVQPPVKPNPSTGGEKPSTPAKPIVDEGGYIVGQLLPKEPTYIKGILLANKKYPLPSTFAPGESQEAREAFTKMAAEASLAGYQLHAFSTYRSFEYQTTLYDRYVERDGKKAADRYSARPGYSEHQTGLAFDIGEKNFEQYWASKSFGETEAGKWLADNAHRYGFILRYPKGKEHITGYMHESWHFRYVGVDVATEIYTKNITLEEYLGVQ